jgi:hypothetical protein
MDRTRLTGRLAKSLESPVESPDLIQIGNLLLRLTGAMSQQR